jgi:hypothetical protein
MKVELKAAYLIAFATLGYTYVYDSALDQVRSIILSDRVTPGHCAFVQTGTADTLAAEMVYVVRGSLDAVLVTIPPLHPHRRRAGVHGVYLPLPGSDPGFYERLSGSGLLRTNHHHITANETYEWPSARSLPRHWDSCAADHPRSREIRQIQVPILPGETGSS